MTQILLYFLIPGALFLIVSLAARFPRLASLVIVLNIGFLAFTYFAESRLLGEAKPIYEGIPFYKHGDWSQGNKILWHSSDGEKTYILVEESKKPTLYVLPYNAKFSDKLKRGNGKDDVIVDNHKRVRGKSFRPSDSLTDSDADELDIRNIQRYEPKYTDGYQVEDFSDDQHLTHEILPNLQMNGAPTVPPTNPHSPTPPQDPNVDHSHDY